MSAVTTTEKNAPTLTLADPLLDGPNIDPTTAGLLAAEQFRDAGRQIVRGYQVVLQPGYFLGVTDVRIEADTIRIPANFTAKIPSGTITLLARNIIAEGPVTLDVSGETHESKPATTTTAAATVAAPGTPNALTLPFAGSAINIAMPASPPTNTTAAAENRAANGSSATAGSAVKNGSDGANGTHGKHGGHGGSITVAAETLEGSSATAHFTLLARGGNGGDGQAGGHGGNGTHGNNGKDADGKTEGGAGETGGNGGNGGKGGDAGNGGNGGQIAFLTVTPFRSGMTTVDIAPGKAGTAGKGGDGGQAGQGGYGGLSNEYRLPGASDPVFVSARYPNRARPLARPAKEQRRTVYSQKGASSLYIRLLPDGEWGLDGSGGAAGKAGTDGNKGEAPRGYDGAGGDSYQNFIGEIKAAITARLGNELARPKPQFDVRKPFAVLQAKAQQANNTELQASVSLWRENVRFNAALSLEYRLLLLRNVKMLYLQRTDDSLRAAATVLIWLASVHPSDGFFADLEAQSVMNGWTSAEIAFRNKVLTQRARFDMVRNQIGLLLQQLGSGLDYFGNAQDWVPALPLERYREYSQSLVSAARGAETLFAQYLTASANASRQSISATDLKEAIEARLKAVEKARADLLVDREAALAAANSSYSQLDALEATLIRDGEAFVQALRSGLRAENVGAVFSIIKSVAVSAVGFGTVGSALKAGGAMRVAASTAVDKLLGDKKPKPTSRDEVLIGKLDETHQTVTLDKATRAAASLLSEIPNIIEKIGVLSDNSKRIGSASNDFSVSDRILRMDREAFKEMLMKVGDTVSAAKKEQYWKSFNQYLDRVNAYATAYARYAGTFLTETRLLTEKDELQQSLLAAQEAEGNTALITHPDYLEALSSLLFNTKVALQDFLYQAGLAYRYWALEEPPAMPGILGNVTEADAYAATLTERLTRHLNQKQGVGQSFRLVVTLTEKDFPEQFKALRQNDSALFVLDETVPAIAAEMALKANIRVSEIDIHLPGAFPGGGRAGISFIHTGTSNFIRSNRERWHFSHIPTDGVYEYRSHIRPAAGHAAPVGREFIYKADPAPNDYGAAGRLLGYGAEQVEKIEWVGGGTVSDQKTRILPALLGGWRLQLPAKGYNGYIVNDNLNPGRLTSIIIIFQGTAEAYRGQR